ncbi:low molecular weight phosphotyrosine protein phosphatase, partial [Paraburkholderia sp. SIMBA_049]
MIDRVLVVCEGNICRSPLACAMLAQALPGIGFSSAGTHALVGEGADPLVLEMARERGVSLDDHVAAPLTDERVRT